MLFLATKKKELENEFTYTKSCVWTTASTAAALWFGIKEIIFGIAFASVFIDPSDCNVSTNHERFRSIGWKTKWHVFPIICYKREKKKTIITFSKYLLKLLCINIQLWFGRKQSSRKQNRRWIVTKERWKKVNILYGKAIKIYDQ